MGDAHSRQKRNLTHEWTHERAHESAHESVHDSTHEGWYSLFSALPGPHEIIHSSGQGWPVLFSPALFLDHLRCSPQKRLQKYPQYCWEFHDQLREALSGTNSEKRGVPSRTGGGENSGNSLEASNALNYRAWGVPAVLSREIPGNALRAFPGSFRNFSGISSGKSQPYWGYGPRLSPEFRATRLSRRKKGALSGGFLLIFLCLRPNRAPKKSAPNPGYQ